jgi:23S rRNA (adenine2503-C2)-methyltransferase
LAEGFDFSHLQPVDSMASSDQETQKTLFQLPGNQAVEAVIMLYDKRRTLCISTQAGCAMGCLFCATGQMGFQRNLSGGEIIEQVLFYARQLQGKGEKVTNVVLMGMGEPFHNYEATFQAIDRLNQPDGFNFGARRFTVSTVGLIPAIRRFTAERRQVNLAVSLHAAENELRTSLIPINRKYPLEMLMDACLDYVNSTNRRITFEWALILGVNDSLEQAQKLTYRLKPFLRSGAALCHVNIIPLNPTHRYTGQATTRHQALAFQAELKKAGIPCTIRLRRGIDIQAGCGQLAIKTKQNSAGV